MIKNEKTVEELISSWRKIFTDFAALHQEREKYMVRRLQELKNTLPEELKNKSNIKILIFLGAYHTEFMHHLYRKNEKVSRPGPKPYIYGHLTEAQRRHAFGKEVSDDLVAKSIFEYLLDGLFSKELKDASTRNTSSQMIIERRIVEKFSMEEIREIIKQVLANLPLETVKENISKKLKDKNIDLPTLQKQRIRAKPI